MIPTEPTSTEIRHVYQPAMGSVDVKVAHGRDSVSVEIDVTRPRCEGETFFDAALMSAELAAEAYRATLAELAKLGVEVGPFKKGAS